MFFGAGLNADSIRVCSLLQAGIKQPEGTNLMLFYGHRFVGTPYVAATLDGNAEEELVVNTRQLDCTTFVENVVALTLTTCQGSVSYQDYLRHLRRIRYSDGIMNGYASRNHYFSQWIQSNQRQGIVREITGDKADGYRPFTAQQTLRLYYMSRHPQSYPMLRNHPQRLQAIARMERQASGPTVRYIPCSLLDGTREELSCVQDGDILAIVTKKDGLDTTHIGLAEWGKDGHLHLLNASSIHKQVVVETMTLQQYMQKHPTQLGVRVIRVVHPELKIERRVVNQ